ncbi:MAG: hypothetical protein DRI71_08910 [Bacteroidetes bacterium]|nr:MAG: hypothetical protein DRI71_08910 [Bacteroidota bacterium]
MATTDIPQLPANTIKTNLFDERFLYNVNRDSFSKISAKAIFDDEFKENLFKDDYLYIIIGTDSGLLPQYIQKQGIPLGTRYLFIEIEEILEQLSQHQLIDSIDTEIVFSTINTWKEEVLNLKLKEYSFLGNVHLLKAICVQQANLTDYVELSWRISEELQALHFQFSSSIGTQSFLRRQIENIADNILPIKLLENIHQDKTAIILAGGPSLTKILPWVKENRKKLIVFSVSRVSRQLINKEIEPDYVFSVDPQAENIDVSKEMFLFKNSIFIHSYHVDSSLINQWAGIKLYFGNRFPWKTDNNIKNKNSAGPTVSNSALAAAHYFGCKQILLAGFDLCFTKEGITHAEGSDEAISGPKYDSSLLEVETYSGEKRSTEPEYHLALASLGVQAKQILADNKIIVNLSPDAAKADNISHLPPEKITLHSSYNPPTHKAVHTLDTEELQAHYQAVLTELKKAIHHITSIKKLSTKALKINNEMYGLNGEIKNYKDKREIDNIEKLLKRKHRTYGNLIKMFGIRNFLRITSPHGVEEIWSSEKAKQIGSIYYSSFQSGSQELLLLLEDSLLRVQSRLEELKDTPNFSLLINQWKADKSYNRATTWEYQHPNISIPNIIQSDFQELKEEFQNILNLTNTQFKRNTEKQSSLTFLKTKTILLFKHKKIEALKNLKNSLEHITTSEKESYKLLISAYIAELEGESDLALQYHDLIINTENSTLLEESLLRKAPISINKDDHSNTLLALECLSQISPAYLPFYAESCRIVRDYVRAIDSYTNYINFFPEDIICKLKLTRLYMEMEVYEAAGMMLDHILLDDPYMEIAINLKNEIKTKTSVNT